MIRPSLRMIWRCVLALAAIGCIVYIFNGHIPLSGVQRLDFMPDKPNPLVGFWPGQKGKESQYFDLRTDVLFDKMDVAVKITSKPSCSYAIGVRMSSSPWNYRFTPFSIAKNGREDGFVASVNEVPLADAKIIDGKYTFVLAPVSIANHNESVQCTMGVDEMTIVIYRQPLSPRYIGKLLMEAWRTVLTMI